MQGTSGNDRLSGSDGNDTLEGLLGNDTLLGSRGDDVLDGGGEFDTAVYDVGGIGDITLEAAGVVNKNSNSTDRLIDIERIVAPQFGLSFSRIDGSTGISGQTSLSVNLENEQLIVKNAPLPEGVSDLVVEVANFTAVTGTDLADFAIGNGRSNLLEGGAGDDTLFGRVGDDTLTGGTGNDRLSGDGRNDRINGGEGNDSLFGGTGFDNLFGDNGNDVIFAQADNDTVSGGDGNDTLSGNEGDDLLRGGVGNDQLTGDAGRDVFSLAIDEGTDTITDFEQGIDVINLPGDIDINTSGLERSGNNIIFDDEILATVNISAESLTESDFI